MLFIPVRIIKYCFKKVLTFVKEAAQINMNCIPTSRIQKNVLSVAVAKTYDESDHRHDSCSTDIVETSHKPVLGIWKSREKPLTKHGWKMFQNICRKGEYKYLETWIRLYNLENTFLEYVSLA